MENTTIIQTVEELLNELLATEPEDFLVSVKVRPTNNIKVNLDSDNGISIEKCVRYNRALYKKIEEKAIFEEGNFSLELSSPGLDEPLKMHRQYVKNIGRNVEVTLLDSSVTEGKLVEVTETEITLEVIEGKGKKAETKQVVLPLENIKTTTVQIQF
ncbi:MAG: ribosome maturation factor [Segetibacter sp.]|nr:ribosome maturation factor [Segetibacter sp.]